MKKYSNVAVIVLWSVYTITSGCAPKYTPHPNYYLFYNTAKPIELTYELNSSPFKRTKYALYKTEAKAPYSDTANVKWFVVDPKSPNSQNNIRFLNKSLFLKDSLICHAIVRYGIGYVFGLNMDINDTLYTTRGGSWPVVLTDISPNADYTKYEYTYLNNDGNKYKLLQYVNELGIKELTYFTPPNKGKASKEQTWKLVKVNNQKPLKFLRLNKGKSLYFD